ncbi:MAG: hypothetical protein R3B89_06435 [Polyangiaceae bacterium]
MIPLLLREWQRSEVRASDLDLNPADWELAEQLERENILALRGQGKKVRVDAFAFVGRLQLGNLQVTITPKVGTSELLQLVRYAYGGKAPKRYDAVEQTLGGQLFQDLLLAEFLREVTELWRRGLRRDYREQHEWLGSPRGKIQVGELVGQLPRESLPCSHYLRSLDTPLNRALLGGVWLGASLAVEHGLRSDLRQLGMRFEGQVARSRLTFDDLNRAIWSLDRLTGHYESALQLIELMMLGQALRLEDGQTRRLPGFVFDMNRFFQALLSRFLREHLDEYEVVDERALKDVFRWDRANNPNNRRAPTPRADYAVHRKGSGTGGEVTLLDAKYRDLWQRPLPREMLYQLTIYALSQHRDRPATAAILYPTTNPNAALQRVEVRDPWTSMPRGYVDLRPVILSELLAGLGRVEGRRFAAWLVTAER